LGESEWLDLLADDQGPMDRQTWRPLFLALATHLVQRSGLWALGHDYLKQAIQAELLPTEDAQKRAHLAVADHFSAAALSDRKVTELPWQQWQGGDDDGLLSSMCDVPLLVTAVRLGRLADLGDYWKHLQPKHDVVRTYVGLASTVQATPGEAKTYGEYVEAVAVVLEQLGLYEDAENFFGERLRVAMRSGEPLAKLVAATNRLVEILRIRYEVAGRSL
jgi:hypothetical protein